MIDFICDAFFFSYWGGIAALALYTLEKVQ